MLLVQNLHAKVDDTEILHGIDLKVQPGEVHAIMGPNGSGKSTFANILAGKADYAITDGSISYQSQDLTAMSIEARSHAGLFVAFQYPVVLPGVTNINFLKATFNANRQARGLEPLDAMDFLTLVREKLTKIGMSEEFIYRGVNEGFSGGEKKRNEVLQMSLLDPTLCVLDETDSGLDIDALKAVADGVNQLRNQERAFIVITHYQRLLDYIKPDFVHVLSQGNIVKSGDSSLANTLEEKGYQWLQQ